MGKTYRFNLAKEKIAKKAKPVVIERAIRGKGFKKIKSSKKHELYKEENYE